MKDAPKESASASEGGASPGLSCKGSGIKTPCAEKATAFFPEAAEVDEEDGPRVSEAVDVPCHTVSVGGFYRVVCSV
ncbi:hypothetical protein AK812_SmicGene11102 [Symbiodinium microadriaticum]|uniref:Uncharacterized protein n=1 Tax=Symbiodinium microadriaticum TaxID=2951 RepID=A0A1Q9EE28_SYMMI|nr:hypothetical protein AK812_SmicGene11102 [Symbiodinium microadriaticum]